MKSENTTTKNTKVKVQSQNDSKVEVEARMKVKDDPDLDGEINSKNKFKENCLPVFNFHIISIIKMCYLYVIA